MTVFVGLILVSQFCFLCAALEHTFPEEFYVYNTNTDPKTYYPNLPKSDEDGMCGMWVYLTAKQKNPVPQVEGASTNFTIDLRFEHPNFEGYKIDYVMDIEHDGETKKIIHICFSKCPTIFDQNDKDNFTLVATTENIPIENAVDLRVTSTKSFSYIERELCSYSDGKPLDDKEKTSSTDASVDDKGNTDVNIETYVRLLIAAYGFLPFVSFVAVILFVYICWTRPHKLDSCLPRPVPCSGSDTSGSENFLLRESRGEKIEVTQIASPGSSAVSDGVKLGDPGNVRSAAKKNKKDD